MLHSKGRLSMHARYFVRILVGGLSACLAFATLAQSVSGTPSTASQADISFIRHATNDGASEIKLSQMALEKSSSAGVKALAQRMIDDHTTTNDALRTLAQGKHVTVPTPPAEPDKQLSALKDKDGAAFDKAWAEATVKSHQKAVALFTAEKRQAQDPDVHNFAAKTLPVLDEHLKMARDLQDQLALPDARNSAMGRHTPVGESAFDHVSSPAGPAGAASQATPQATPAPATSMGMH